MVSFSESEIFRILENANARNFPPDELSQILNTVEIKDKLLKVSNYYAKEPTAASLGALKNMLPKDTQDKDLKLIESISSTLKLDHTLAYTVHKEALLNDEDNEQQLNHSDDYYTSLDPVVCARDFHLRQRQYLWKIVQELIRISLDTGHAYHLVAVEYVMTLCDGGFVGNLIKSMEILYSWKPFQIDEKHFPDLEGKTFRDFNLQNDDRWSENILAESEMALDTLILLLYESTSLSIQHFSALLTIAIECQFNVPLVPFQHLETRSGTTSGTHLSSQNNAKRFHLKWIAFAISVFQFYLSYTAPDDRDSNSHSSHPFFQEPINPTHDDIIVNISKQLKGLSDPIGSTMKLLWFLFLDMFNPLDYERNSWNRAIEKAKTNGAVETLTILCNNVLPAPSYTRGSSVSCLDSVGKDDTTFDSDKEELEIDSEFQNYFFILQDCVNALISKFCNASTGFSDIDLLSQLVDMTFRGDSLLCRSFWNSWTAASLSVNSSASASTSFSYPLCQLLHEVSKDTVLEPLYMIRMVNAVTCFTENSVEEVILLLMKPVPMITTVCAAHVNVFQKSSQQYVEWDDWYEHLSSSQYKYQSDKAKRQEWHSLEVSLRRTASSQEEDEGVSLLTSPPVGAAGVVRTVTPHPENITAENNQTVTLTVQWDSHIEWFSFLVTILNDATTNVNYGQYGQDALYRLISSLTLFANLISQISVLKLSEIWEEVCVKVFFRRYCLSKVDVCYSLLRNKMREDIKNGVISEDFSVIQFMQTRQQELYDYFTQHGIGEEVAYNVASQFPIIYCPDFEDLVTNMSVCLVTSLMRCKVASPTLSTGSDSNTLVGVKHTIWQSLLQKSLYLLQCVAQSSTSPSGTLHILSKITRHYELSGPNGWVASLFRVAAATEGVTGRYMVTTETCNLLRALFQKLQTPMPPDSRALFRLFCQFDNDGNGGIDREELRQGLNNFGYTISASAVNIVFQKIDKDNSGTVEFAELLQYANHTTLKDVEEGYEDTNSDMFKAEKMLVGLLRDLTAPGGGVGVEMMQAVTCSTVEFCVSCLSHLDTWKHTTNLASRWSLTLSCLTVLHEILARSSPAQCEPLKSTVSAIAWQTFLHKFVTEKPLQTSLMQLCLLQGLTALQSSYTSAYRSVPQSFKAVLCCSSQTARDLTAHDVLPLNFSRGYYEVADSFEKQLVEQLSLKALGVYSLIVDSYVHFTNNVPSIPRLPTASLVSQPSLIILDCFEQFITQLFSNASFLCTLPVTSSRDRAAHHTGAFSSPLTEFPCSYFTVMFALLDFPKRASKVPRAKSALPQAVLCFVVKLLAAMKAHDIVRKDQPPAPSSFLTASSLKRDPYSFLTGAGISNMASLCVSLCTSLKLESHLDVNILDFITHLCAFEPLSLVQLFNVPNPSAKRKDKENAIGKDTDRVSNKPIGLIDPKDSYLVQTIEDLFKSAVAVSGPGGADTNIKFPEQLFKLLQLILTMMDQTEHKSIGNVVLYLCKKKHFWEYITGPLMINVPDLDPNPHKKVCEVDNVVWEISPEDTVLHSTRLLCHSTALRILARARFGLLFFIDERDSTTNARCYESAEAAEDLVDKFFDEKSRQNRFLSWVEFYTRVDVNARMHNLAKDVAARVGVNLETFVSAPVVSRYEPHYVRLQVAQFGEKYLYDTHVINDMKEFALGLCAEDDAYKQRFEQKNAAKDWDLLSDIAKKLNLMWTIADAQTDLLKSWKEFIETFIKTPPNRPINYVRTHFKKQRDDTIERCESISTPRSGDASPSSRKQSSFKFDRRSYELASEIIKQVAGIKKDKDKSASGGKTHGGTTSEGEIAHHSGAVVAVEKCDLLVSMLHYQLRDVTHRDADPSSSQIAPREKIRFDKNKMEGLLQSLETAFQRLTEGLYIRPPSYTQIHEYSESTVYWKQYKDKIMLRLLSAKLMLFQALCQSQQGQRRQQEFPPSTSSSSKVDSRSEDHSLSIDNAVCLQTFGNIRIALNAALQDSTSFSRDNAPTKSIGLPLPEKIILVSLRLFTYIAPKHGDLSIENMIGWRETMASSDIGPMLVSVFRHVCSQNIPHVTEQHEYSKWTARWNGRLTGGAFEVDIKGLSEVQRFKRARKDVTSSSSDAVWATLNTVLDTFLAEGLYEGSLLFAALLESDLLVELCQAPVFLTLQRTLCGGGSNRSGSHTGIEAYMGYNATSGEPSALMTAWCKIVQIVQCALRASVAPKEKNNAYQCQITTFIATFHPLLLLPLPTRITHLTNHHQQQTQQQQQQSHYYSIQQMRLTNIVMLLFKDCVHLFPTWKVLQADVYSRLIEKTLGTMSSLSLAVGDNDKSECNQKVLSQALVVISKAEHDEASEKTPEMSRMRDRGGTFDSPTSKEGGLWSTPPRGGFLGTPGTGGSSFGGSFGGKSTAGSCSKASRNREKQHNLSNFFIDAAWAMFAVLNPCMALLRNAVPFSEICGEEYEIDYGDGGLRLRKDSCELPLGSQTYYMPNNIRANQPFTQGIIIKVNHERKSYNIQATNGLVDVDIPCSAVAFSVKPLIPFGSVSTLNRDLVAESRGASFNHFPTASGTLSLALANTTTSAATATSTMTTAHLLRLLICLLKWSKKWNDIEVVEHEKNLSMNMYVDLSMLCGQLVWILVVNLAHHSCCATDDVYYGIGEQLDELHSLIQKEGELDTEERADAFLNNPLDCWDSVRLWVARMTQRIMYRAGGMETEWAAVVDRTERVEEATRPSLQLSQSVSVMVPKTGGTGSLRGGAVFK